jgi:hypothetical protein
MNREDVLKALQAAGAKAKVAPSMRTPPPTAAEMTAIEFEVRQVSIADGGVTVFPIPGNCLVGVIWDTRCRRLFVWEVDLTIWRYTQSDGPEDWRTSDWFKEFEIDVDSGRMLLPHIIQLLGSVDSLGALGEVADS